MIAQEDHGFAHQKDAQYRLGERQAASKAQLVRPEDHREIVCPCLPVVENGRLARLHLLLDECLTGRPDATDLDDHLAILCPSKVRRSRGLRIEGSGWIWLEFTFVPRLSRTEVEGAGEYYNCTRLIGVPVRLIFPSGREPDPRHEKPRPRGITVQHDCLRGAG